MKKIQAQTIFVAKNEIKIVLYYNEVNIVCT